MSKNKKSKFPEHVWYACYGSNLREQRFNCYLVGGQPEGATFTQPGARDNTAPVMDDLFFSDDWQLTFARQSSSWEGKAVAFLAKSQKGVELENTSSIKTTCFRIYQVKFQQFVDVYLQENGIDPNLDAKASGKAQAWLEKEDLGKEGYSDPPEKLCVDGWYRRLVKMGVVNGMPIVSFTSDEELAFEIPGKNYLHTIGVGLFETLPRNAVDDVATYLSQASNVGLEETKTIAESAFETYLAESETNFKRQKVVGVAFSESACIKRVRKTGLRLKTRREFIIQLPDEYFDDPATSIEPDSLASVTMIHKARQFKVVAWVVKFPRDESWQIRPHEVAMDQKVRIAIGAREGDWVSIEELNQRNKSSYFYWFLERRILTQPQLMRVDLATFEDMEIPVARIPNSTFALIGAKPGSTIAISSTTGRVHVRAVELTSAMTEERNLKSKGRPGKDPELNRFWRSAFGIDLPPIYIDYDARKELGVKPGDAVRVVRDSFDVFAGRVYFIALPILFGLVSAAISFDSQAWIDNWMWRLGVCFSVIAVTFFAVLWEVSFRFRRK